MTGLPGLVPDFSQSKFSASIGGGIAIASSSVQIGKKSGSTIFIARNVVLHPIHASGD